MPWFPGPLRALLEVMEELETSVLAGEEHHVILLFLQELPLRAVVQMVDQSLSLLETAWAKFIFSGGVLGRLGLALAINVAKSFSPSIGRMCVLR